MYQKAGASLASQLSRIERNLHAKNLEKVERDPDMNKDRRRGGIKGLGGDNSKKEIR
jgi:hypothetical protein